ncbi:MAG: sugar ABC transporter permease [Oscillospiraceae bacterium]|nr:sugar ABC transporter permease [Oscillospiraceae bacterium]
MKKGKRLKLITPTDTAGWMFVLPFVIGFIFLFAKPVSESLVYTFHNVKVGENGLEMTPIGWENYNRLLFGDAAFIKTLWKVISEAAVKILVIMFISMFLAILLNEKFPGRLLFRAIMFLPVIFAADQVLSVFSSLGGKDELQETTSSFFVMSGEASGFVKEIISSFGPLTSIIEKFTGYASQLFNLLWSSGIQIILFIIGLQTIPAYLYEVAEMEGATKWETFWKITFPLLTPSILLCLIYTIIDYFNASTNTIVRQIDQHMLNRIDYACAMSWLYSVAIFILVIIVNAILSRKVISLD